MTRDADFKKLVRARMVEAGETYLQSRTALMHAPATPDESADITALRGSVRQFFDDGRLRSVPVKRTKRMAVLLVLMDLFEPRRAYTEAEVSQILRAVHDDHAYLRRELVNAGYLEREANVYTVAAAPPTRDPRWAPEFPRQEAIVFETMWSTPRNA